MPRRSVTMDDVDVRRVPPDWAELLPLVEGARQRGFTEAQVDYLRSVVGLAWAKAFRKGQGAPRE
jgi:hypothetical protein